MKAALLAALVEGACGDDGRRAVETLARVVGLDAGASVVEIADAVRDPARRDVVRKWGEELTGLLAADPQGAARDVALAMERDAPGSGTSWYDGDHADFRGGVFLREVVGVQVVIQQGGTAVPEALAGLPPRPGGFAGRAQETAALLSALDPETGTGVVQSPAVLVAAVSGLGGIGKTALAVETAHLARERGWFPGGVLFVDLHGYDPEPVTFDRALQALLRALGTRPEHIPATADERAALYRSTLAARAEERGAVLVLADNASSPDQVRPLLPGDGRHRVLVTSRDRLPQLGARLVPLDQLTPKEAYALLDLAVRIASPDDSRIADAPEEAGRLAGHCGHLPLALQIAAALLAEDTGTSVADLVGELAAAHDPLDHLDDGARSVRAAFDLSYRRLSDARARLLRLLALAPGPEVSDEVAAVLVGADAPPTRDLKALARAHLVERGSGRGRWRLHDLVRAFGAAVVAGDPARTEEGETARRRVMMFCLVWARAADQRLRWLPGKPEPGLFANRAQALAWLDRERATLVAAVSWVSLARHARTAGLLSQYLAMYLHLRRHFDDLITTLCAGRDAARRLGDRTGEAVAWSYLAIALQDAGRGEEPIDAATRACDVFRSIGDRRREANARSNLGAFLVTAGRSQEAIEALTRARELYESAGDGVGLAGAWANLGLLLEGLGQWEEAIEAVTRARDLYQAAGGPPQRGQDGDQPRQRPAWGRPDGGGHPRLRRPCGGLPRVRGLVRVGPGPVQRRQRPQGRPTSGGSPGAVSPGRRRLHQGKRP